MQKLGSYIPPGGEHTKLSSCKSTLLLFQYWILKSSKKALKMAKITQKNIWDDFLCLYLPLR
jgi:hypothetical protein